ncbi:O-antigen polymerase [Trichormus variabilis ATCC 29413]|uniref:O-antigen polymerase n=3 Tax=Anabaena variabilis TaxID=264691 RepID=Q3M3J7_TRIV2|nr:MULTISPECIES: O-antigen ligase [Nostocaceae]ABA24439.1 O-antigen polymerase [Trichormus variabilis ATCC 29413]MBC1214346.1 O-antigen ligase family protein [Trichormus variabilis ARAD]MBC1268460.1 O-antigen ligase family protein [Trichormus variabilis FSR]MBC1303876.1 O-antigen ligase family protein [Trichormus variabilis N2B]MBC1309996.1 O-antigen ligase family protein [Trichormus variabilis PNB]
MKKYLLLAEKAFTVLSLLHYSGAPLVVILSGGASEGDDSIAAPDFALIQFIFLIIYFITFALLVLRWKKVIQLINKDWYIWLLLLVAIFSIFWSDVPAMTQSRVIALSGTLLFPLYLASRYTLKEQLHLLAWTFGIAIVGSFLFAFGLRNYGRMAGVHFGTWRGIYNHKNVLGKVMAPSAMVFLLLALQPEKKRWLFWGGFIASIWLIIASKASSPLINVITLSLSLFLFRILRWRYNFMIPALVGITTLSTIAYILMTTNAEAIAALLGKDLTLTGRTNFWPLIIDKIAERPWFGYGYGAFWLGWTGPSADIWYSSGWKPPNSHNGYLDLCLELGLVGLSLYVIDYLQGLLKALAYVRSVKTSDGFWPGVFLMYVVLSNLTESTLLIQNNFFFVIQISILLSLRICEEQKTTHSMIKHKKKINYSQKTYKIP